LIPSEELFISSREILISIWGIDFKKNNLNEIYETKKSTGITPSRLLNI